MIITQSSNTPLLSQVQLVTSGSQPNQLVLQTGGSQPQLMVAQPQTALVHGQAQTVLVAQTPNQQGTHSKTIIILQPQSGSNQQKIVMTPQGQQMVVTQMQRPLGNNMPTLVSTTQTIPTAQISTMKMVQTATVNGNAIGKVLVKADTSRPTTPIATICSENKNVPMITSQLSPQTVSVIKDLSNPFICEWRGCTW